MDEWGRVSDSVEKVQKTVAMKQDRWGHGSFNDHDQSRTTSRGRGRGRGSRKLEEARPEGLPRGRWEHDNRDEATPGDRLRQSAREDISQDNTPTDKKTTSRKKNKHADIQVYVPRAKRVQYENPNEYAMCTDEALHAEGPLVNVQETNISRLEESPLVGAGVTTGRTPPEKPPSGRKPRKARPAIELYDPHSKRKEREKVRAGKSHDYQLGDGEIDRSHDIARMESDQWEGRELGQRLTTVDDIVTDQWESSFTEAMDDNQKLNESERLQYTREEQNDRHHHRRHSKKKKLKDKEKEEVPCDSERTEKHHKSKHKQKDGEERRRSHSKEHKERRRSKHKHSGNDATVGGQHDQDKQGQVRGQIQGSQDSTEQTDYQSFRPGAVCDENNQDPIDNSLTNQVDISLTNQMDINSPVSQDMQTDICAEIQGECVSQTHTETPQLVELMELGTDQCSDDVNNFYKNVNEISSKEEYSDHGSENEPKDELLISTAGSGITSSEVDQLNSMTDPISNADPNGVGGFISDTLEENLTKTVSDVENISDNMGNSVVDSNSMLSSGSESILNESSSGKNQAVEFTERLLDDHFMDVQMTNETTYKCEEFENSVIYEPSQQNQQYAGYTQEKLNSGEEEDIHQSQPFIGTDQSKKCTYLDNNQLNTTIHMIETPTDESGATSDMDYTLSTISGETTDKSAVSFHIIPADVSQSGIKSPAVTNQSEPSTHQSSEEAEMNEPESFTKNHQSEGLSQNPKVISQSQTSSHTAECMVPNSHSEISTGTDVDEISDTNISSLPPEPAVQSESPVQNCVMEVSQSEIQFNPLDQSQSIKSLDTIDQSQSITLSDDTIDQSESTSHPTDTMIPSKSLLQPSDITSQSNPSLQTDAEIIQSNLSLQSETDAEIIQPNPALRTESEINQSNPSLPTDGEISQPNPPLQTESETSQSNPSLQTASETSQRNSSLQADGEITQSNLLLQTDGENNQSEIAQEQTEPQSLPLTRCVTPPSAKSQPSLVAEAAEDEDEDSWDKLYDDSGEALDSKLMNELTTAVGKVEIQKPQFDYYSYMPKDVDMDYDAYGHLLEIYDFPTNLITRDLVIAFKEFQDAGFDIKWVDDNHAIGIFSSNFAARSALTLHHPLIKVRPLSEATRPTKLKAKRACEFLQPYKPRPEMVATVARNLVAGALGLRSSVPKEKRDEEKRKIKEAKEKKRQARHDKKGAWDGTIGKCAMDDN